MGIEACLAIALVNKAKRKKKKKELSHARRGWVPLRWLLRFSLFASRSTFDPCIVYIRNIPTHTHLDLTSRMAKLSAYIDFDSVCHTLYASFVSTLVYFSFLFSFLHAPTFMHVHSVFLRFLICHFSWAISNSLGMKTCANDLKKRVIHVYFNM